MVIRAIAPLAALALAGCTQSPEIPGPVMAQHGSQGTMFVANKRGASLSRIDVANGEETHRAETCDNPHELTVSPDEALVAVACYSGRTLQVFATDDLHSIAEFELGENARVHSALWLDDFSIIAGAEGRGSLYHIVDTETDAPRPPVEIGGGGPGPHLLALSPDEHTAWGTIIPTGEVVRYDLATGSEAARRRIGNAIEAIALSPDGSALWVASNADNVAYRLDPETLAVEAEVPTGEVPIRIAPHPSGRWMVTSNFGSGDLTVIDTRTDTVARTIPVSGSRDAVQVTLVFNADGTRLYAAETATDTIAEVDFASGEVLRRIRTGPGGDGLAIID